MSLRLKFSILLIAWLIIILALGASILYIFNSLDQSLDILERSAVEHRLYQEMGTSVNVFFKNIKDWSVTGDNNSKKQAKEKLSALFKKSTELKETAGNREALKRIEKDLAHIQATTKIILDAESPKDNKEAAKEILRIEARKERILLEIEFVQSENIRRVSEIAAKGTDIKKNLRFYLSSLLAFGIIASLSLILLIRRVISNPFNDLMEATEKIGKGEFSYRIDSKRTDEIGIISNRFDEMVEKLQTSVNAEAQSYAAAKNQLLKLTVLYDLATTMASTVNLDELLKMIAAEISKLLNARVCIIRLFEENNLNIKSFYNKTNEQFDIPAENSIAEQVIKEKKPILIDLNNMSALCMPLYITGNIIGTLGLYDKTDSEGNKISFTDDNIETSIAFSSMAALAIEKAKLYDNLRKNEELALEAKKKKDILFDSVQGGIVTLNKDYIITSANKFMEHWTGIKTDEVIGKNAVDIFHKQGGICPHCVSKVTFETGQTNSITLSKEGDFAELTSYPIKDENDNVIESVVFIQDITDRILYHEEILSLYKEVAHTKDYLESFINNSADAIITSDLNGIIISWNPSAEKIYGFSEIEAVGEFLPFALPHTINTEKEYIERIKHRDILRNIETIRQKKDGSIIEVSLTLSPIKNTSGEIIGISGISRDISEKKRVETELIRRNQELSRLSFISSAMRETLQLEKLLRMVLTAATMSDGLGFNRAMLFLIDEKKDMIKGVMGVGPANHEEAWKIWEELSVKKRTLNEIMADIEKSPLKKDSYFDKLSRGIEISLKEKTILTKTVLEKTAFNITDVKQEKLSDIALIQQLGTHAYATVPLISKGRVIGVLWADNFFTNQLISDEDMNFLKGFSNQVASAIENARLFEQISRAEAELENIFRSISDMIFITDKEYTIKKINEAVVERIGKPVNEILGKKCYEIFHKMKEPWVECPHHKSVENKKSYIEEVKDDNLGGTFLTSNSPLFDSEGEFIGTVHVVRDVTELNNLREKLVSTQRMAALGEVAAKVAHEIRNPLVSVGGFARRLEKKLDGNLKEYAEIIAKEVGRLEDILKEILGFVKDIRIFKQEVNLNNLIDDIINLINVEIKEKNIVLVKELSNVPSVNVDIDRVREALLNIFNNAIQVLSINGRITVKTYTKGDYVVIAVEDTGPGIEDKDLPFIFVPFYTTKASGTGLGLAITNRIVEEHKGKIEVNSIIGKGTTFRVSFPKKQ
ncbi:MAG: PAS domain S-box protein [Nitrospiraceae bacterium]|nr:PAS domain S-box protein [Nitrospiraceae bacterium]